MAREGDKVQEVGTMLVHSRPYGARLSTEVASITVLVTNIDKLIRTLKRAKLQSIKLSKKG